MVIMRILYLSQYFPPEVGATQTRAYEMARGLVQAGHNVTMVVEMPNHPSGVIPPAYKGKRYERTNLDGIDVIRVWVKASPVKTFRTRLAFYLSYMVSATLAGFFLARGRYDLIYATSPPLFVGAAALALSALRRTPLVFEVRDLWPESAVILGELKNPRAIALAERLERACYRRARRIVVVTQGIQRRLFERGLPADKLTFIPNGANTDLFQPQTEAGAALREELGLGDAFVVLYAGIIGLAQGFETVLEAARSLQGAGDLDVRFVLVGEGPVKEEMMALAQDYGLINTLFHSEISRERVPAFLSAADVALVPLRKLDLFKGALPSKMFDAWAAGCPTLVSIEGEAQQVLEEAGAGRFVEPENPQALVRAIRVLATDRAACREMGIRGRAFVEIHYSRQAQARQLERVLRTLVGG
jgi:colanic acid biosynthesis glycosyl transferase WcaI